MTDPADSQHLRCAGCHRRIGRRGRVLVVAGVIAVCPACSTNPQVHDRLFFACRLPNHVALEHNAHAYCTAGRARQLLQNPYR